MKYPRNEIWERKVYESLIKNRQLTILFRPGDRVCDIGKVKCFNEGEEVTIKVLKKPGDSHRDIKPEFSSVIEKGIIEEIKKISLSSLLRKDFKNSYPNVTSQETLRYHLGLIYNKEPSSFKEVTKIKIKYLNLPKK